MVELRLESSRMSMRHLFEAFDEQQYIEERNGGYYIAGARISLDSVVYSFERGNSPEVIQVSFPLLKLTKIYGAIALYLDHQARVRQYLEERRAESRIRRRRSVRRIPNLE
jgi:uncharacterized protein (DUF433 family)